MKTQGQHQSVAAEVQEQRPVNGDLSKGPGTGQQDQKLVTEQQAKT